jgi:hypothetical protein
MKTHSQNSEEAERLSVYESWPEIPPKIRRAIRLMIDATTDDSAFSTGETCEETVSQGGGVPTSLSGGDERSEPESQIKFPHGGLPSVANSTSTAENNENKTK